MARNVAFRLKQRGQDQKILFFSLEWRLFSFIWIILLDILVITMALKFYRKDKTAGRLQIPYTIWVLFATYLNFGVWILNR